MIKVSVIVPIYRVEEYLQRCVDSIRNQTLREIEIILVNDGSPDKCGEMCNTFAAQDSRIKVIHKENGGLSSARNAGMQIAVGEYFSFIDSDDYIDLQMLEKLYQSAEKYDSDLTGCGFYQISNTGSRREVPSNLPEGVYGHEQIVNDFVVHVLGNNSKVGWKEREGYAWLNLYKKKIIEENNLSFLSERICYHEDEIFLLDFLYYAKKISFVNEPLYYYQFNENSLINSYRATLWQMSKELISLYRGFSKRYGMEDACRRRIDLYMLSYVPLALCNECNPAANNSKEKIFTFIREVCENSEVQRVLKEPLLHRANKGTFLVLKMVKYKQTGLLYLWYRLLRKHYYPSKGAGK